MQKSDLPDRIESCANLISPGCAVISAAAVPGTISFRIVSAVGHPIVGGIEDLSEGEVASLSPGDLRFFLIGLIGTARADGNRLAESWRQLEQRQGIGYVRMPFRSDVVFADVNYGDDGETETLCLTVSQLEYAVEHELSNENLVRERYPAGWPIG